MLVSTRTALLALTAVPLLGAGAAQADHTVNFVGLTDTGMLVMMDNKQAAITRAVEITGAGGDVLGIDVRPADGKLYAVASDNMIYTIDPETGVATAVSEMSETFPTGMPTTVDFNPAADALRLMSADGTNFRVNADTGAVTLDGDHAFASGDMHAGEQPMIVAGSYINSRGKPETTALYTIDSTIDGLIQQVPPNDGTLSAIGKLGIAVEPTVAFEIETSPTGLNTAYLVSDGTVYTVDIESGEATELAEIVGMDDTILDIAALPDGM